MSESKIIESALAALTGPDAQAQGSGEELTIGEMASLFSVSLRTLRFYEDRKLLRPRREGTARIYGPGDKMRLQMILKGKQLGFTLTEISELIGAQDADDDFEHKLQPQQILTQIQHLERQRREIDEAIERLRATHARVSGAPGALRAAS